MSLGLLLAAMFVAGVGDEVPFTRVRSTERHATALLREGYDRSPTFRALVDRIQQSNATVVVQLGACKGGRIRSCVVNVNGSARARHIWITVDPHTTNNRLIATMGHELQHAVEIVEDPEAVDAESVMRLYRELSFGPCAEGWSDECETELALATERRVLEELTRNGGLRFDAGSIRRQARKKPKWHVTAPPVPPRAKPLTDGCLHRLVTGAAPAILARTSSIQVRTTRISSTRSSASTPSSTTLIRRASYLARSTEQKETWALSSLRRSSPGA